jgi:hypothetical protein
MSAANVVDMAHAHMPSFLRQRERVEVLDKWHRNEQDPQVFKPRGTEAEYEELMGKSPTPWAATIVTAVVQNAEFLGPRLPTRDGDKEPTAWASWQRNRMDSRQAALYRASCAHGAAFVLGEAGTDRMTGGPMTVMKTVSALRMAAFYDDDDEEWPTFALLCDPWYSDLGPQKGWYVKVIDEDAIHYLTCIDDGTLLGQWEYISYTKHNAKVTPVVRYAPNLDIDGRASSDFAPLLPLLARVDQDTFDRLIVQRFGAWKVRYIAGMVAPTAKSDAEAEKLRLRIESILIAEDKDTKFGTLDATDLAGFIAAHDADLRDLSATSQTPPHHMLGLSSNLQAESLAAAEAGLQRKSREHRISWGESHEQLYRLDGQIKGDRAQAEAFEAESRWRDTESRSMEQAAMSLGMLATNLKVPVEMLWERIPGWSDGDVKRAMRLVKEGTGIDAMLGELENMLKQSAQDPANGPVAV